MGNALAGKAVVITGAGAGIGAAYARHAAAEGAKVVVNDINAAGVDEVVASIRKAGGTAVGRVADVTSWGEAEGLVQFCVKEYGALDGFANNAALFYMARPEEETEARLRKTVEVNVLGTMFCGIHALKQMLRQGRGSLVNISSGAHAGAPGMGIYGGTKGAAASLTYSWAMDAAGTGVRVNAITPLANTRMVEIGAEYAASRGKSGGVLSVPIPPERNAPVMSFLLSDAAAGINGQIVRIQDTSLSLMTHPSVWHPAQDRGEWTTEAVREAFEKDFGKRQLPMGIVAIEGKLLEYASPVQKV